MKSSRIQSLLECVAKFQICNFFQSCLICVFIVLIDSVDQFLASPAITLTDTRLLVLNSSSWITAQGISFFYALTFFLKLLSQS